MTKFKRALEAAKRAEEKIDGLLMKLIKSKWTWAIVVVVLLTTWLLG